MDCCQFLADANQMQIIRISFQIYNNHTLHYLFTENMVMGGEAGEE